jgi:hypothetical protein
MVTGAINGTYLTSTRPYTLTRRRTILSGGCFRKKRLTGMSRKSTPKARTVTTGKTVHIYMFRRNFFKTERRSSGSGGDVPHQ